MSIVEMNLVFIGQSVKPIETLAETHAQNKKYSESVRKTYQWDTI